MEPSGISSLEFAVFLYIILALRCFSLANLSLKMLFLHEKTAMILSSLPLKMHVPCGNRTPGYSLGAKVCTVIY